MPEFDLVQDDTGVYRTKLPSRKSWILAIIIGIAAFIIGILIGKYAACDASSAPAEVPVTPQKDGVFLPGVSDAIIKEADLSIRDLLLKNIDNKNIEKYLKTLTEKPHIAGSPEDEDTLVNYIKEFWENVGFDDVQTATYDILLSYPDKENPNMIELLDENNEVIYQTPIEEDILTPGKNNTEGIPPFNAYSPKGIVTGQLVYVNYGRVEDYIHLESVGVNVTGCVAIARYGKIFRGSKVDIAQRHGVIGLIIYSDPKDYTIPGEGVYPDTWWLPGSGAQRGSIFTGEGDPLTPGYPATDTAYRYEEDKTIPPLPKIPAHPIGYTVAVHLFGNLTGTTVTDEWTGGINITYKYGPGFINNNWKVRMNISTQNARRNTTNVIGFIKGAVEPDRYVIFGNHRDAWVYGAIDPSSGTAVMMETARVMAALVKSGSKWRPRRTILFCSWGAEEYGMVGSTEWVEEYIKNIKERTVAYINIDISVEGTNTLRSKTTPLLYNVMYETAKLVENPNATEIAAGRKTVYDTWLLNRPWNINGEIYGKPEMQSMGSASDFAPILQKAGVTSVDFRYTYDKNLPVVGYPLYHSQYETFYAMKNLIDVDFKYHQAVARIGAELARNLADSLIIPLNASDYAWDLENLRVSLDAEYGSYLRGNISNYDDLEMVIKKFGEEAADYEMRLSNVNKNNPLLTRVVNDQLMLLEKAFLDPAGLPLRPLKKHIIMADSSNDVYAGSSFPGLIDLLFEIDKAADPNARWEEVKQHFSVILFTIQSAASTLRDVTLFHS